MIRVLLLLLLFILLVYWCINHDAPKIERDVLFRTQATLLAEGHTEIMATVDGRDVLLTGQVDTENERQQLLTAISATEGVRVVDHTLALTPKAFPRPTETITQKAPVIVKEPIMESVQAEPETVEETAPVETLPGPPDELDVKTVYLEPGLSVNDIYFSISKSANKIKLNGYLPNEKSRQSIIGQIKNDFDIEESISIPKLDDEWIANWTLLNSAILSQIIKLTDATVSVRPEEILISGQAEDHIVREDIEKLLRQSLPSDWNLDFNINIPLSETSVACEMEIQTLLSKETIYFRLESAEIDQDSTELLDSIIEYIKKCTAASFLIEGHTDSVGDEKYNQLLSEVRAQSVKDYLVSKGIDDQRIKIKGYGESQPIADNSTIEGRSKNRRIEFVVLGESL